MLVKSRLSRRNKVIDYYYLILKKGKRDIMLLVLIGRKSIRDEIKVSETFNITRNLLKLPRKD